MDEETQGVYKHFAIVTATRHGTETFKAVDDMPAVLRATCLKALDSKDTATLIIADQKGLEAWRQAQEQARQAVETEAAKGTVAMQGRVRLRLPRSVSWRLLLELAGIGAAGLAVWLLAIR